MTPDTPAAPAKDEKEARRLETILSRYANLADPHPDSIAGEWQFVAAHVAALTAQLEAERAERRQEYDALIQKIAERGGEVAREKERADAAEAETKALREAVPYSPLFPNWREELAPISGTDADNMHDALRLQHPAAADAIVKLWNDRERLEIALNSLLPYCRATLAQPADTTLSESVSELRSREGK